MKNERQTESEFEGKIALYLKKHFEVNRQVKSECGKGRVDIVIKHSGGVYFGIEVKKHNSKRGDEIGQFVKQAMRYSEYRFEVEPNVFKKIPILICPPLSYEYFLLNEGEQDILGVTWHKDRHGKFNPHHTFNGFLGSLGIGELRKGPDNSYFISFSNKEIWSSRIVGEYKENKKVGKKIVGLNIKNYKNILK